MDNPLDTLRYMLLAVLGLPLAAGLAMAVLGSFAPGLVRRVALALALVHLGLTASLVWLVADQLTEKAEYMAGAVLADLPYFEPIAVPGDPGQGDNSGQIHETTWAALSVSPGQPGLPAAEVQFFVGLDGLNVWLIALTSLMSVVAILISWESVRDRPGAFYGWLFVLQTGIIGAFASFDVVLFYVFFELTLIPAFFLIGHWGSGGGRRDAARKFFLYTLFGSLLTLVGVIGVVLTNPTPVIDRGGVPTAYYSTTDTADRPVELRQGPVTFSIPRLMRNVQVWAEYNPAAARRATTAAEQARAVAESARRAPDDQLNDRTDDAAEDAYQAAEEERTRATSAADMHSRLQVGLFILLMIGFAVKTPIVPLHTWLPTAYNEAPIGVTVLLAALMSKLGTFGILRIVLPLTPDAAFLYGLPVFGFLGAVGIVYGAFCAFAQRDIKLLVAYSSVSHLGFVILGLFTLNHEGVSGAALHMVNHGLSTGAMFGLLAFLIDRYRTLDMNQYGGLIGRFPGFAIVTFLVCLASIGLPGLNNFVSEMLMLGGLFEAVHTQSLGYGLAAAAAFGILLSAWYTMTMLKRVFFGPDREPPFVGGPGVPTSGCLTSRESVAFGLPIALCLLLGLYPQPVLDVIRPDAAVVVRCGDMARERAGYEPSPAEPEAARHRFSRRSNDILGDGDVKSLADVHNELLTGVVRMVLPEVALVGTACLLFVLAVVYARRFLAVGVGLVGLIWAMALTFTYGSTELAAFWGAVDGTGYSPHVLAAIDPTGPAGFVRWLALAAGVALLLLSWPELRDEDACEYIGCLLVAIAGASLVGRANDLVSLFLALEMVSIPTYVLLYLPARDRVGQEAAVKYFLLSILSSGVLLFGFSYLYGLAGTTNLGAVVAVLTTAHQASVSPMALIAVVLVIAGLGFRIAAVPFHFYAPDVYQAGPTGVVAQIAFLPKLVGFVALARVLGLAVRSADGLPFDATSTLIPLILWVIALVTMTVGNALALLQDDLKRLLAYSGIAHSGYMLIGIVVACSVRPTADTAVSGLDTTLFYLVAYGLMTVGSFALVMYLNRPERPVRTVDDLAGLGVANPLSAVLMAVFLFSLIGLPLTAGFAGKFLLFVGAFDAPVTPPMGKLYRVLVVVAAVNAAIGAVYYLRIVGAMYLRSPISPAGPSRGVLPLFAAILCAAGTLAIGVYPEPLAEATRRAAPVTETRPTP